MGGEGVGCVCRYLCSPLPSEKAKTKGNMETSLKRGRGRPKGSVKMTIQRFADNPPLVLPKTDHQRLKELKELMIRSGGKDVAQKVIEIALNDEHPHQLVALKMCLDRTLPVSLFEKDKSQRSAVTINITGLGQEPLIVDTAEQPEDVEAKYG